MLLIDVVSVCSVSEGVQSSVFMRIQSIHLRKRRTNSSLIVTPLPWIGWKEHLQDLSQGHLALIFDSKAVFFQRNAKETNDHLLGMALRASEPTQKYWTMRLGNMISWSKLGKLASYEPKTGLQPERHEKISHNGLWYSPNVLDSITPDSNYMKYWTNQNVEHCSLQVFTCTVNDSMLCYFCISEMFTKIAH